MSRILHFSAIGMKTLRNNSALAGHTVCEIFPSCLRLWEVGICAVTILQPLFFTWYCCLWATKVGDRVTYLSQVESAVARNPTCKKSQNYFSAGCHRETFVEVIGTGEEMRLKAEKLRCKEWMQQTEVSWSSAKAADCSRCRLALQGEQVIL